MTGGLFRPACNTQAYLKCGILGFAGSGKTYTATSIAIGLHKELVERAILAAGTPVAFIDTETGSDFVAPRFADEEVNLVQAKTRAFVDLLEAVQEVAQLRSILIVDSISHFWSELQDAYEAKRKRKTGLTIRDWMIIKKQWRQFTDLFVNSTAHIILCGRAAWEFGFHEGEDGKREMEKTGVKMRVEGETGFEPSLLLYMDRHQDVSTKPIKTWRTGEVLKDRSSKIDGKVYRNPTYRHIQPHINALNLGGEQVGVDTSRNSKELISTEDKSIKHELRQKAVTLDEVQALLVKHYPTQTNDAKRAKADHLEKHFATRSWARVKESRYHELRRGYNALHLELEGQPADLYNEPVEPGQPGNEIDTSEVDAETRGAPF